MADYYLIQLRADSAANWAANNPILAVGEPGVEIDTGKLKFGDGVLHWNSLTYNNEPPGTALLTVNAFAATLATIATSGSATDLTAGTVPNARLSAQVARKDQANTFGGNSLSEFSAVINTQTGTSYSLQNTDNAKVIVLDNASPITLSLPGTPVVGFSCTIIQANTGQVTTTLNGSATRNNTYGHTKLRARWSTASLVVISNTTGSNAVYVMTGDTAA